MWYTRPVNPRPIRRVLFKTLSAMFFSIAPAWAQDASGDAPPWSVHAQLTHIWQYNPAFHSLFEGPQSFDFNNRAAETTDATLYAGVSPWRGAELWIDPEVNQGIALGNTLGMAGYINGDGSKEGRKHPYLRIQRLFFRQTLDLGGGAREVKSDQNQLAQDSTDDRVVVTAGKFDVVDVFDTNSLAHDGRTDFLNWALIDTGSFDYASDAWGYTLGGAVEWYQGPWVFRSGAFDLSSHPNGATLTPGFRQFQLDDEIERHFTLGSRKGKLALTAFLNRADMGTYADAIRLAESSGTVPDTGRVRTYRSRAGLSMNGEQEISDDVALFLRAGWDDATYETFEYTDIDRTVAAGGRITGSAWGRAKDEIGFAAVENWIGREHERYLAMGGLGILVGDGALPRPGAEQISEVYYSAALTENAELTLDGQLINHPAYNKDRGPVAVAGVRLHLHV